MRIALPYYGNLMNPGQGLSQMFFIVEINPETGELISMKLEARELHGKGLATWLQEHQINGVISNDQPQQCLADLKKHHLWHQVSPANEPREQINLWLQQHCAAIA